MIRNKQLLVLVGVVLSAVLCVFSVQRNAQQDRARDLATQERACEDRRDARQAVRDLVLVATSQPTADYSRFPSYSELDVNTKAFLQEMQAASRSGGLTAFREAALAKLPIIVC